MPLKLVAGRNAKTQNFYIRGSYLGVAVDKSCRTNRRSVALAELKRLENAIERGEYPSRQVVTKGPTFLSAAVAYLEARPTTRKRARYVPDLIRYFGEKPLSDIDQAAIDAAAIAIKPDGTPMNRTAAVYTPVSAILHHAGVTMTIRRPKGFAGKIKTDWLTENDASGIITAADSFDPELATLLTYLLYTGARIGAALDLRREDVNLAQRRAWARSQKGQPHMDIKLHADLCARLDELLASHDRHRAFRFHYGAHLMHQLTRAKLVYLKMPCPVRCPIGWREPPNRLSFCTFHTFRHTWATWFRRAGGDVKGLVASGNWRSERVASRYQHAVAGVEWDRVDKMPSMGIGRGKQQ